MKQDDRRLAEKPMTRKNSLAAKMPERSARHGLVALVVVYWCFWVVLTHWPKIEIPPLASFRVDKIAHFSGYLVLAGLLTLAISFWQRAGKRVEWRDKLAVLAAIAVGGILDEWTQPYFGRSFEWGDYLADLLGGITGIALAATWIRFRQRSASVTTSAQTAKA